MPQKPFFPAPRSARHSLGQRASALILFILTQHDSDVIIVDQPEDDLDNQVIYEELIQTIKKEKRDRFYGLHACLPKFDSGC